MDYTPNDPTRSSVPPPHIPPATAGGLSENTAAAISYLTFIPAIIFLLLEPYNRSRFVRFHAIQCISLTVVSFAIHLVLAVIPIIGPVISVLVSLVFLVAWILCIIKAAKGEWYKLPVIGDFALKQAGA